MLARFLHRAIIIYVVTVDLEETCLTACPGSWQDVFVLSLCPLTIFSPVHTNVQA